MVNKMKEFLARYPQLNVCEKDIEDALELMIVTYNNGGKILVCGNGGSSADADHIVGELMKGFLRARKVQDHRLSDEFKENLQGALPAISLSGQNALLTAFNNDMNPDYVFAQQVYGYANENDLVIGISTSGNSKNVVNAIKLAKETGLKTIALTGENGGILKEIADVTICAPATETYKIQEHHLPIYHYLCMKVEEKLFE